MISKSKKTTSEYRPGLFDIVTDARRVLHMFSKKTFDSLLLREGTTRTFDQTFAKSLAGKAW